VQRDPTVLSTTHQTPQISTQPRVVSVHNGDNHEPIQLFDEVISIWQPWRSITPSYYLPRKGTPTSIVTFAGFQNQPSNTNINLVPINLKMEWLHLLNRLEQLHHINLRPSNQLVSISNLKHVELWAISTIVWQDTTYQQGIWPTRLVFGPSERSQVPHHKLISKGNQNVGTLTCSYCQHVGHLFNCCPFVDVRLR